MIFRILTCLNVWIEKWLATDGALSSGTLRISVLSRPCQKNETQRWKHMQFEKLAVRERKPIALQKLGLQGILESLVKKGQSMSRRKLENEKQTDVNS